MKDHFTTQHAAACSFYAHERSVRSAISSKFIFSLLGCILVQLLTATTIFAQTQFWSDDFEDAGSPSAGSRVSSISDFNCTNQHYFARNTPATFSLQNGSYSNYSNSKMYAFEDIDYGPTCANASIGFAQTITWSGINIAGKTGLSFRGLFGADPVSFQSIPSFPTNYDHMEIYYRIDGGAWTKIIGIYANGAGAGGGPMALDTNNDLIGDGTPLTYALSEISSNITGTGTTLDLRFNVSTNATVQELGIDNFRLYESAACNITAGISSQTNVSCNGGSNGSATVAASGGAGPYTYSWAPSGGTAATATGLTAGTYTVTITDNIGCTKTQTVNITQPTAITSSVISQTNIACNGGSTGAATITASGGTGTLTYNWTPGNPTGDGTPSVSGLTAGLWTCTITDANSCTKTQTVNISQPTAITSSVVSQTNIACNGGSTGAATITASGGTGTLIYNWTPGNPTGDGTPSVSGLTAGLWTCTITDANSCTKTQTVNITQPTAITSSVSSQTNVSSNGGSDGAATIAASGGTGTLFYSWSPAGGTAATATGLTAGTYTVTITDANSCSETQTVNITQPAAITSGVSFQTNVSCYGGSNGSATITASGGTGSYSYSWAPSGGTAATATGLAAGTYTVTITDANSTTKTQTVNILQPTAITSSISSQTNVSCNGGSNGSATITASGGTGTLSYSWAPSGGTAATATGLTAGTYTVTITDANTCSKTQSVTITEPSAITSGIFSQTNVSCNGGSNGSATIIASGGTGTLSYSWAPGGRAASTATGLTAGTYTVTITDANTCFKTQTVTITQPSAITSGISSQTNVSCNGGSNGSATVTASGGTGPYTYSWAPSGGTAATATGLTAGTYTVTITDANACSKTQSVTITQPSAITSGISSQTNISCNGGSNGSATVTASGGTGTYTYSWAPGGGTAATATGLTAGTYTVTITDANACSKTQSVTITQPSAITSGISSQTNISCNGGSNGSATIIASGGTGTYTYSWAPSGGTAATATGLAAGTYTVTITDANSCSKIQSVTITQPSAITSGISSQTNVSCNGGSNGSATITASGGSGPYTYSWAPGGGTAATATGLAAGTYTVTITDANSCSKIQSVTITQPAAVAVTATPASQTICSGGQTGITLSSVPAGADFTWTVSAVRGSVSGATSGNGSSIEQELTGQGVVKYTIIPASSTCPGSTKEVLITVNALTSVEMHPADKSIYDEETARFSVEANNADVYQWQVNRGSGFDDISDDAHYDGAGTNILTVSNATGEMNGYLFRCVITGNCAPAYSNSATLTVTVRARQTISFAGTGTKIYGDDDYTPAATSNAGLELEYSSSDVSIASIENGKIHIKKTGQVTITASQPGNDSYKPAASVDQVLTISKKPITLSLSATPVISKVYDTYTAISLDGANYQLKGVEEGDDVSVTGEGAFENNKADENKTISVSNFVLGGEAASNYALTTTVAEVKGVIEPAKIIVSLQASPLISKTYDGLDEASLSSDNFILDGVLGEDEVNIASGKGAYSDKKAGVEKEVTVTGFVLGGGQKDNYIIENSSAVTFGDIKVKDITVSLSAAPAISKVYDGSVRASVPAAKYQLDAVVTGDDVSVKGTAVYNNKKAGDEKAVTVGALILEGEDAANYHLSTTELSATGSIEKATLAVTLVNAETAVRKEYDGTTDATLQSDNYTVAGIVGEDDVVLNSPAQATYDNKHGGEGKKVTVNGLEISGEDADNYMLTATAVSANIGTITRKVIGVTADAKTKVYGQPDPELTYSTEGKLEGDVLPGALTRTEGKNVGEYKVAQGSLDGGEDYVIEWFQGAGFTITPKALTVTAEDKTKKQGTPNPVLTISYDGLAAGDQPSDLETQPTAATTATTSSQMGYYDIEVSGAASANYEISYVKGKLTVMPSTDATYSVKVWSPGPEQLQIKIYTEKAQKAAIILYTETGQQVVLQQQHLAAGVNSFTMSVAHLSSSTYILSVNAEQFKDAQKVKVK